MDKLLHALRVFEPRLQAARLEGFAQVWQQQLIAVSASEARASHMVTQLLAQEDSHARLINP